MNFVSFFTSEPLSHPSNLVGQLCAHFVHMAGQWDFLEWPSRLRDGKSGCLPGALCHRLFPGRWFIQLAHPASIYIYIYIHIYIYIRQLVCNTQIFIEFCHYGSYYPKEVCYYGHLTPKPCRGILI